MKILIFVSLLATSVGASDVTGDFSTSNEGSTVDSNNSSETINYNGAGSSPGSQPVMSAIAPTMMGGGGNDSCLLPSSTGIQLSIIGISRGDATG